MNEIGFFIAKNIKSHFVIESTKFAIFLFQKNPNESALNFG